MCLIMRSFLLTASMGLTLGIVVEANPLLYNGGNNKSKSGGKYKGNKNDIDEFDFADLKPSRHLNWIPCWGNFTCANLQVPLDYDDQLFGTTNIAFVKSDGDSPDAEDVLFNPGGPGVSGIDHLRQGNKELRAGGIGSKYNLIGFDPRGVGYSGPNLNCFTDPAASQYYDTLLDTKNVVANNKVVLTQQYAEADAFGKWCSAALINSTAGYAGTVAVAQDMLHFVKLRAGSRDQDTDNAKLNFYGASYGTILGSTFATMFPDRVGKFVLNGVADVEDWYKGDKITNLNQLDGAVEFFFSECYAEKEQCDFNKNATSVDQIKDRFNAILDNIEKNPLPFYNRNVVDYPVVLTHHDLRLPILMAAKYPSNFFVTLDLLVTSLEEGDATLLAAMVGRGKMPAAKCDLKEKYYNAEKRSWKVPDNFGFFTIKCIDSGMGYDISSIQEYTDLVDSEVAHSRYGGEQFSGMGSVVCRSLDIKRPESQVFKGFTAPRLKTANPILFLENMLDPVTPSAHYMSTFFSDSKVITAKTAGHCVNTAAESSKCMNSHLQKFWETGELPPSNTECYIEPETRPFRGKAKFMENIRKLMNKTENPLEIWQLGREGRKWWL